MKLLMLPAQIAVVRGVLAGRPIALSMGTGMLILDTVMIAIMVTVIALMLVAIIVIAVLMGKCGNGRQG